MKKQAFERDDDGSNSMDRISLLPQPILHQILNFLPQKAAVQTCVLSKSWRYIGPTRPNIEFHERHFTPTGNKESFLTVVDKTLQRYLDQKVSIQNLFLAIENFEFGSFSFLEKWIPIVLLNLGVRTLKLYCFPPRNPERNFWPQYVDLPWIFVQAESLRELYLSGIGLSQENYSFDKVVLFKHLQTLSLHKVCIEDKTLQKIISNCPMIECVVLFSCERLRSIKVNEAPNLKSFDFHAFDEYGEVNDHSIEIDVPTIETIKIDGCENWLLHHGNYYPHLKSLCLKNVRLSTESFNIFSINLPCLEELKLHHCYGFNKFQLSSRSIKRLTIVVESSIDALDVVATNLCSFKLSSYSVPSISFTTSREWKSDVSLYWSYDSLETDHSLSTWLSEIHEALKALSGSKITLHLSLDYNTGTGLGRVGADSNCDGLYKPLVVVEFLKLELDGHFSSSFSALINGLFRVCRPKYIGQYQLYTKKWHNKQIRFIELLCNILVTETEKRQYFWQQELEQAIMEVNYDNGKDWHLTTFSELLQNKRNGPKQIIRFRLKWRDLEMSLYS